MEETPMSLLEGLPPPEAERVVEGTAKDDLPAERTTRSSHLDTLHVPDAVVISSGEVAVAIWQRDLALTEARAEIASLRRSVSELTRMGAELAFKLDQRSTAYSQLVVGLSALLPVERALLDSDVLLPYMTQPSLLAAAEAEAEAQAELTRAAIELPPAPLETELEQTAAARAALEARLDAADAELAQAELERQQLQSTIEDKDQAIAALQAELQARLGELENLSDQVATARSEDLQPLEEQVASLEADNTAIQAELDERTAELDDLRTRLSQPATLVELVSSQVPGREADPAAAAKIASVGAAIAAGVSPQTTTILQDLSAIDGIGKVFEQRLYKAGIGTYWEVANLSDEGFETILRLTPLQLAGMDLERVRAHAVSLAQETAAVGMIWEGPAVDDFETIDGIGKVFEQRLYDAGIRTYAALVEASPEQLAEICHAPDLSPPDFGSWIDQARRLLEEGKPEA